METREFAIIGGGIGGCASAALLSAHGRDVVLLEKEPTLGGCASTFKHNGRLYNAGATTVSGYFEGGILKRLFDDVHLMPTLIQSDPAIVIIQEEHHIRRSSDIHIFLNDLQKAFPHPSHELFWNLVRDITRAFYTFPHTQYYSNRSIWDKIISLGSFLPLMQQFKSYLFTPAMKVIESYYGSISREYRTFLDAQIMIVAQAHLEEVSFFTAAVALGYTFMPTHYPIGGMGSLCTSLVSNVADVRTKSPVESIRRDNGSFRIDGKFGTVRAKKLVMGTSVYDSGSWFDDSDIKKYYSKFTRLDNHQSAFVLYMSITGGTYEHHYQIIDRDPFPHTLSQSVFVSISDPSDNTIAPPGILTLTASIHVDSREWIGLSPAQYIEQKWSLQKLIEKKVCDTLGIMKENVIDSFAATPKTFKRFINRSQLGGNPLKRGFSLLKIPSNDSPIPGLYHAGDTVFAAQGWPGITMGAYNLLRTLHE